MSRYQVRVLSKDGNDIGRTDGYQSTEAETAKDVIGTIPNLRKGESIIIERV
jgi:hypothetical protein